jgi:hypothetical protein
VACQRHATIDPFRQHPDLLSSVLTPGGFPGWVANAPSLIDARAATAVARAARAGTWQADKPLMLDAHQLRAMWDLRPPHRWVVDLSGQHYGAPLSAARTGRRPGHRARRRSASRRLLAPYRYLDIPHHEDRLYIPLEFVSLWLERGWTRAAARPRAAEARGARPRLGFRHQMTHQQLSGP